VPPHTDHPTRGALYIVLAALLFSSMGGLIRVASLQLNNETVVFLRNLFGLLVLLPWLARRGIGRLSTRHPGLHLLRSLAGLAAMYCFFYAISQLALSEAVLLNFSAPLFIPFIAAIWLQERVPIRVLWAVAIGFAGAVLIMRPGLGVFQPAAGIGLASGFFAALAMVTVRRLSSSEPPTRVVFYYGLICTSVSSIPLLWAWQSPQPTVLGTLFLAGIFATAGQLALTQGYRYAPAAQAGPFIYTSVLFAGLYGWWFWAEIPDVLSLSGTVLIVMAGILAIRARRRSRTGHDR
jgi:drug/metabolite transporter (DMT)-like permease